MQDYSSIFDPLVASWFRERYAAPTDIQIRAWQAIARGNHVLMTAPTGSGKTMAAFLWALDQLITGQWSVGGTRVLYVSPLKALNNDIQRNLLEPLAALQGRFHDSGKRFPAIQVSTRSGDTPPAERRRMLRQPPEILITTPESLNLLLSSAGGRGLLGNLKTVILDEIHSIINSRRGTFLMTAVERLVTLSGEFQRVALSATIQPMATATVFVGGFVLEGPAAAPRYLPRRVETVTSGMQKSYALKVQLPETETTPEISPKTDPGTNPETKIDHRDGEFWEPYAAHFKERIRVNRSTLIFTNSRRLCEKLTYLINIHSDDGPGKMPAYSHHGSLSKSIRTEVEQQLKAGNLKAIVATSSLELGIDIGALDEVILVQSPPSVSAAVQRIGRAGHSVGECSRGAFFPAHGMDIVCSAVLAKAVLEEAIEASHPPDAPLDVLAQVLLSMLGFEAWRPTDLFNRIRTVSAYHTLSRRRFDLVLEMLEGRFAEMRLRELSPKITHDRTAGLLKAKKGALLNLYASGGVIPDRGYYGLRHTDTGAKIGELDEEFVWEARVNQVFTLGTQNWRIQKITSSDVWVSPAPRSQPAPPFWRAEDNDRSFHLAGKIGRFLEYAEACLDRLGRGDRKKRTDHPDFESELKSTYKLDQYAVERLKTFLISQRKQTGCALPHRHHLVVETTVLGAAGATGRRIVLHNFWGGRVNRPLAIALEAAWEQRFGTHAEIFATNDGIALVLPHEVPAEEILGLVRSDTLESLLQQRLAQTGFFGARFRECAGRALLLPRRSINQRMPLWLSRLKAQKLLTAVGKQADFPILVETWRTCLQDEFELSTLRRLLLELESGQIAWTHVRTTFPSPMAAGGTWQHINHYMYQPDQPASPGSGALSRDLFEEVALEPGLRPQIDDALVRQFEMKSRRLAPGYAPDNEADLLDWVKERLLIPHDEWRSLLEAMDFNQGLSIEQVLAQLDTKLVELQLFADQNDPADQSHLNQFHLKLIAARESLPRLVAGFFAGQGEYIRATLLCGEQVDAAEYMPSFKTGRFKEENGAKEDTGPDNGYGPDATLSLTAGLLGEWLRFYGPVSTGFIAQALGLETQRLQEALDELIDSQTVIQGRLTHEGSGGQVCDRENFEFLLRRARAAADPGFKPLEIDQLPLFLAHYQGITQPGQTVPELMDALTPLLGWAAQAGLWETDILPARMAGYQPGWLDQAMQAGELIWIGRPGRKVLFTFEHELDLVREDLPGDESDGSDDESSAEKPSETAAPDSERLFPDGHGRYPFSILHQRTGLSAAELNKRLWQAVWEGMATNDGFAALRHGVAHQFKIAEAVPPGRGQHYPRRGRRPGRRAFERRKASLPQGNWYRVIYPEAPENGLEKEERNKERVRLLLDRYGIVFRELLARELPHMQWGALFRSLRLMELSGEVIAGHFFTDVPGLQFIAPPALDMLGQKLPQDAVYWINAADPASLCGIGIAALKEQLPRRLPGNHLVYHGSRLAIVSRGNGKHLHIYMPPDHPPDHPKTTAYFGFLKHMLTRPVSPLSSIAVESINDHPAGEQGAYIDALKKIFEVLLDPKGLTLYNRHD